MGTILNNQFMCMVESILEYKVHADHTLQVAQDVSSKIDFILPLLRNLVEGAHNVLIFSQTRKMLNLIEESVLLEGHKFLHIDGTTKVSERAKIVKDFQEGSAAPILLLTSQVGGLGNTLTKADHVITKDVIVYRLMTCGTIEEKIYKLQVFKGGLFRTAMEHKEQTQYFNQEDIHEFFSLPPEGFDVSLTQHQLQEVHGQQLVMHESLRTHIQFLEQQGIAVSAIIASCFINQQSCLLWMIVLHWTGSLKTLWPGATMPTRGQLLLPNRKMSGSLVLVLGTHTLMWRARWTQEKSMTACSRR